MTNKKKENKKIKKKSGILKKVLLILIILLVGLAGFIVYKTQANGGGMSGLLSTLVGNDETTLEELEPLQILLLGVSTDLGAKLTDTIMVATYNPKEQTASLLSIPRDTYIGTDIRKGNSGEKINALYARGVDKIIKKVNEITGLNLENYMVVENQALIELVDLIGGVEFEIPMEMSYHDPSQDLEIELEEGKQILNGEKAEQLIRFRKNDDGTSYPEWYGPNDTGRMKTQRNFIMATVKQTLQLKNIFKIKDIIDLIYEHVETNLSISTIKSYVPYAIDFNVENIQGTVLPTTSLGPPNAPLWFEQMNKKEIEKLMKELYSEEEPNEQENTNNEENPNNSNENNNNSKINESSNGNASSNVNENTDKNTNHNENNDVNEKTNGEITKTEASKIKIEILNGSGSDKKLAEIKKILTKSGYKISKTITTTETSKTTIINKTNVDAKFENNIKELLEIGNISKSTASSSNVDITIIIGKDYKIKNQ